MPRRRLNEDDRSPCLPERESCCVFRAVIISKKLEIVWEDIVQSPYFYKLTQRAFIIRGILLDRSTGVPHFE